MLGHELRNPMAAIRTAVQLLKLRPPQDAASGQATEVIDRQVQHLARLVDDLLDVSRISRGKVKRAGSRWSWQPSSGRAVEASSAAADGPWTPLRRAMLLPAPLWLARRPACRLGVNS